MSINKIKELKKNSRRDKSIENKIKTAGETG